MKGYIYKFRNKANNKVYIGQTIRSPRIRYREHITYKNSENAVFHKAIKKYGEDNFEFSIIREVEYNNKKDLIQKLNALEIQYIKEYNSLVPNGYNISSGGNNSSFRKIQFVLIDNEPIIDTETGIIYENAKEWLISENLNDDEQYNLYMKKDYKYRFINQDKIKYPGECYPENSTIFEVLYGESISLVKIPIYTALDKKLEILERKIAQLEEENKALKENRKPSYII